jgi:hypothetical protein
VISNIALHWGTLHRTIRTKDAAIAWFGAQQRLAASAFVEVLAGVSRHRFALGEAANRAYQRGFQKKLAHTQFSYAPRKDSLHPKSLLASMAGLALLGSKVTLAVFLSKSHHGTRDARHFLQRFLNGDWTNRASHILQIERDGL